MKNIGSLAAGVVLCSLMAACGGSSSITVTPRGGTGTGSFSTGAPRVNSFISSKQIVAAGDTVTFTWDANSINTQIFINDVNSTTGAKLVSSINYLGGSFSDSVTCVRDSTILNCGQYVNANISTLTGSTPLYVIIQASGFSADFTETLFDYSYIQVTFP